MGHARLGGQVTATKSIKIVLSSFMIWAVSYGTLADDVPVDLAVCRIHFTKSWEDQDAPLGTLPTTMFSKELVKVFESVGAKLEPAPYVPWTRATEQVARGTDHGLSVALETPERGKTLAFLGPIFRNKWYAYKTINQPLNAEKPKVGVYGTYAKLAPIQEAVKAINGEIIGMPLERLGRMLEEGRIDLIYSPPLGVGYLNERLQQSLETVPGIEFEVLTYVAVRHDAPCMAMKDELNEALQTWAESDVAKVLASASSEDRTYEEILASAKRNQQ